MTLCSLFGARSFPWAYTFFVLFPIFKKETPLSLHGPLGVVAFLCLPLQALLYMGLFPPPFLPFFSQTYSNWPFVLTTTVRPPLLKSPLLRFPASESVVVSRVWVEEGASIWTVLWNVLGAPLLLLKPLSKPGFLSLSAVLTPFQYIPFQFKWTRRWFLILLLRSAELVHRRT